VVIVYGKKPRRSKTSEVYELEGLTFFLYNAKSTTKGITEIYLFAEPYMLLKVAESNEKAKLWITNNITRVKQRLMSVGNLETITREEWDKMNKPKKKKDTEAKASIPTVEELQDIHNEFIKECRCLGY
jgi:hypothetical protein